jgi:ABC-type branched-subunit amino acid transport system substrate-binding protein
MITHKNISPKINNSQNYTMSMRQCQSTCPAGLLLLALLMLGWLTGCAAAPRTLKIGLVAPFEGAHRPLGYEALFAAKLAVQERNLGGGIQGYQIELVALNDFDDPAQAAIQARALAADPAVLGVVGHLSAGATQAALPVYRQANLTVSIPWPAPADAFIDGGAVSVAATAEETATQLEMLMQQQGIEAGDAPPLYLNGDGITAAEIILSRAAAPSPMFGQVDVGSPQLVQTAKVAADGLIFVSPGPNPTDVGADDFAEAFLNLAGFPPGPRAALAYDAANILLDAIEQAILSAHGSPTRAQVHAEITGTHRQGVTGTITFAANGKRLNAPIWVYQITAGEYPGELLSQKE